MKKISFLLFTMVVSTFALAQQEYYGGYTPSATTAPTAAKVTAAGGATVNRATGTVQQAVPIHTISQNGFSWNIGLHYSYSGLQVMAEPSPIGLGWDLAATGVVSREVRGLPDDHPKGYHGSENIREQLLLDNYYNFNPIGVDLNDPNYNRPNYPETGNKKVLKEHHAYLLAQGLADGEPDVFRVSAGRLNFTFKLGENLQPVLLSHHNVKVIFNWNQIEVTDSEGVLYTFAAKEIFTPVPEDDIFETGPNGEQITLPLAPIYSYTRSWFLTRIQPPNTSQEITFSYQDHLYQTKAFLPKIYSYKGLQSEFLVGLKKKDEILQPSEQQELQEGQDPFVYTHTRLDVDVTKPVVTKITFAEGSLDFITKTVPVGAQHQYERIELNDFHDELITTYQLTTTGSRRLLDEVEINSEFAYGFEYYHQNDPIAIPEFDFNQDEVFSKMDYWGFYTGEQAAEDVLEAEESNDPVFNATVAGALQRIRYKTGGYTDILYEANALPRTIDYTPHSSTPFNYNHDFELASIGSNSIGSTNKKSITRTFDTAIPITISHSGIRSSGNGTLIIQILKHGATQSNTPYYDQVQTTFSPYLNVAVNPSPTDDFSVYETFITNRSKSFTIAPGTYTFYVETSQGSEASIQVAYGVQPRYRKEIYDRLYGGIRVASIQSTAPDTGDKTIKSFSYENDYRGSSGKIYSVLQELPEEVFYTETSTDLVNVSYPFYVENRGVPVYYSQVSESVLSTKDNTKNGKTVYTFEEPYFFASELDFRTKEFYDRMPKGNIESGIRIASAKVFKFKNDIQNGNNEVLVSEKSYEYQPVTPNIDAFGNSLDVAYPYGIKVISKNRLKREMHYPDWILLQYQLGNISDPAFPVLQDFEDRYINGTQDEFESYAQTLLTATRTNGESPVGSQLKYMAVGVSNAAAEYLPEWQLTSGFNDEVKHELYTTLEYKETNVQYLRNKVTTKTFSDIDPNQFATTVQEYAYDSNNQLVAQTTTDSKGDIKKVNYFYPYHPQVNNTTLTTENRVSSPVKTETYHKNQKQSTALVNFRQWSTGLYLPETIQAAKENASLRDETVFHNYDDKGNPLETSAREGIHTIYVWGYQETVPIAVIAKATYEGMPQDVKDVIAAAQLASNDDINAGSELALRSALDTVRNHPYFADSQITTYTYDPLVGMTTTTDIRNRTTYYSYDHLHRLIQVKDNEDKVIQEYTYNYSNQ
ncbi:RHS repeat domain-containing protein [Aquimarina sp. M1]